MPTRQNPLKATTLIITLIFLSVLSMIAFTLLPLVIQQKKQIDMEQAQNYALHISEAGLNYAKWRLAHEPTNYDNEANKEYSDALGDIIGYFDLQFTPPVAGGTIVTIKSTGWTANQANYKKSIQVRYGRPSFTQYSFLTNSNIWFGMPTNYEGLIHSNGGIRMDSTVLTKATSYKDTYTCTFIHGCSSPTVKPGIWGAGGNQNLWDFPAPPVDFDKITVDLNNLKTLTKDNATGLYLANAGQGYHLSFQANGSVDIYKVKKLKTPPEHGRPITGSCVVEANSFDEEEFLQNYILAANDIIFVEDKVWIDGAVHGRATVVAAKLPDVSANRQDIVLNGNIMYTNKDGSDVLGLIAQRNILFPLYNLPQDIEIDAALLASKGNISRYCYACSTCGTYGTVADRVKNSLFLYGSLIANTDSDFEFAWGNVVGGHWVTTSGFQNVSNQYDSYLLYNPPPYFPEADDYQFISWDEVAN